VAEELEVAAQRRGAVIAVDRLRVVARPGLDETTSHEAVIGRRGGVAGAQRTERIIGIAAVDCDGVQQISVTRIRADEQRQRRRLVGRLAAIEEELAAELDVIAERLRHRREGCVSLVGGQQIVQRRRVVAIGIGEILEIGRRRPPLHGPDQRQIAVADDEAAQWRRRGAAAVA